MSHETPNAQESPNTPSRSEATRQQYMARAMTLVRRYEREQHAEWRDDPHALCRWLIERRGELAAPSWRVYKRALIEWLRAHGLDADADWLDAQRADDGEGPRPLGRAQVRERGRTSAAKMRGIRRQDFELLVNELRRHGTTGRLAADWLKAGVLTGLRPSEWREARLEGRRLIVPNGKANAVRGCGPARTLHLDPLPEVSMASIHQVLAAVQRYKRFRTLFDRVRAMIYLTNRKLWPKRNRNISLYSARHQFCANCKHAGLSLEEVAALMGHAVDWTSSEHYRRASGGWAGIPLIRPDPANIALVRITVQLRPQPKLAKR